MAENKKSTPSEIAAAKLEAEKAQNKSRKQSKFAAEDNRKASELNKNKEIDLDGYLIQKSSPRGIEIMRQGLSGAGKLGNLSARKEATLKRAKTAALRKKMKK